MPRYDSRDLRGWLSFRRLGGRLAVTEEIVSWRSIAKLTDLPQGSILFSVTKLEEKTHCWLINFSYSRGYQLCIVLRISMSPIQQNSFSKIKDKHAPSSLPIVGSSFPSFASSVKSTLFERTHISPTNSTEQNRRLTYSFNASPFWCCGPILNDGKPPLGGPPPPIPFE